MNHPNIVRIVDIVDQNDTIYIIEDFVEGKSLAEEVKRGPSTPEDVVLWDDSGIENLDLYLQANQSHLNDLIYAADEYIRSTIAECNAEPGHKYMPTV